MLSSAISSSAASRRHRPPSPQGPGASAARRIDVDGATEESEENAGDGDDATYLRCLLNRNFAKLSRSRLDALVFMLPQCLGSTLSVM